MSKISDERLAERLQLWFFRDLSSDQRTALLRLVYYPAKDFDTHSSQQIAFMHMLQSLRSQPAGVRVAEDMKDRLKMLISEYRDLAYADGKEGRSTDTPNGDAGRVWWQITELLGQFEALSRFAAIEPQQEEAGGWRDLALQFDNHRIDCLSMLRYVVRSIEEYATVRDILGEPLSSLKEFLSKPPLSGETVLAERVAALSHPTPAQKVQESQTVGVESKGEQK